MDYRTVKLKCINYICKFVFGIFLWIVIHVEITNENISLYLKYMSTIFGDTETDMAHLVIVSIIVVK